MTMAHAIYIVDPDRTAPELKRAGEVLRTESAMREAARALTAALWIATESTPLLSCLPLLTRRSSLLLLSKIPEEERDLFRTAFRYVLWRDQRFKMLPTDEIVDVLQADHPEDYVIAVEAVPRRNLAIMYRGNLEPLVVSAEELLGSHSSAWKIGITDFGQTVTMDGKEIPVGTLLYSRDRAFRQRYRANLLKNDSSFGGSLKRLRMLRGLSRNDLGISAKEVARIERGETRKPHPDTLRTIAKKLRVEPSEIESY
jgi:hypothetical protein